MKVLILAGSPDGLDILFSWLNSVGATVVHDRSWRKAMERIQIDASLDMVMIMTGTSDEIGMKILKSVRLDRRLKNLPLIMMGSEISDTQVRQYYEYNVTDILILPATRETIEAKINRAVAQSRTTVLVVDDEPAILDILEQFFIFERYRPLLAQSYDEAAAILEREQVDVVVSDVMLGGKTGIDLLLHIKTNFQNIAVILVTGYSGKFGSKDILALGADGFFTKPFKNTELVAMLRNCLLRYEGKPRTKLPATT